MVLFSLWMAFLSQIVKFYVAQNKNTEGHVQSGKSCRSTYGKEYNNSISIINFYKGSGMEKLSDQSVRQPCTRERGRGLKYHLLAPFIPLAERQLAGRGKRNSDVKSLFYRNNCASLKSRKGGVLFLLHRLSQKCNSLTICHYFHVLNVTTLDFVDAGIARRWENKKNQSSPLLFSSLGGRRAGLQLSVSRSWLSRADDRLGKSNLHLDRSTLVWIHVLKIIQSIFYTIELYVQMNLATLGNNIIL